MPSFLICRPQVTVKKLSFMYETNFPALAVCADLFGWCLSMRFRAAVVEAHVQTRSF